jgi:hypothetical protein
MWGVEAIPVEEGAGLAESHEKISFRREVISSLIVVGILLGFTCEKLHSELHFPSHWNRMQMAACLGLLVLWCENFGQPLVFSGNLTGLKKSPYLFHSVTFHSTSVFSFDTGFRAGLSDGDVALFFRSSLRLSCWLSLRPPLSSWRVLLLGGSEIDVGRWMVGAIPNRICQRASFTSSSWRFLSRRLAERMGDGLDRYRAS